MMKRRALPDHRLAALLRATLALVVAAVVTAIPAAALQEPTQGTVAGDQAAAPSVAPAPADGGAREDATTRPLPGVLQRLWESTPWHGVPRVGALPMGPRVIPAGDTVHGSVGARGGALDIHGVVLGDAVAYDGDVVLHPGSTVTGDAVAVLGKVRLQGGVVGGEARSVRASLIPPPGSEPPPTVKGRLGLVLGWFTLLVVIGVGVLVFASRPLIGVVETLHKGFLRAFLVGLAGQLAALPALLLLVVGLAVTVIGILLIPFAIVALTLAATGLTMLGFLAVAQVVGGALSRGGRTGTLSERGWALRALFVGIAAFVVLWSLAALATPYAVASAILRAVALTLTWVALTAGLGATLQSRAGTIRNAPVLEEPELEEELSWQTPTPIGGVVAARRPTTTAHR